MDAIKTTAEMAIGPDKGYGEEHKGGGDGMGHALENIERKLESMDIKETIEDVVGGRRGLGMNLLPVNACGNDGGFGGNGMFTGLMLGALLRGGLFGNNVTDAAGTGMGCVSQGIQTLLAEVHQNGTQMGAQTAQLTSNADANTATIVNSGTSAASAINGNLWSGFQGVNAGICSVGRDVMAGAHANTMAVKDAQFAGAQGNWALSQQMNGDAAAAAKCCCDTNLNITSRGYEDQINVLQQTAALQSSIAQSAREAADCCCSTNLNITTKAYETQIRDMQMKADTDTKLAALACGQEKILAAIDGNSKDNRIYALEGRVSELNRVIDKYDDRAIANRTNCLVTQLGDANRAYYAAVTPTQQYPWAIPTCGCAGF